MAGRLVTTKRTTSILGVIALLVIGSTGLGVFLYTTSPSSVSLSSSHVSSSTSGPLTSSSATWFKVNHDTLVLGYNSGLWSIQIQDVSGKPVTLLTAILKTPTQSKICTGLLGGFVFSNCPPSPPSSGVFAANATFTGYASGVGEGSATLGRSYPVIIQAVFADGTTANDTITVQATKLQ